MGPLPGPKVVLYLYTDTPVEEWCCKYRPLEICDHPRKWPVVYKITIYAASFSCRGAEILEEIRYTLNYFRMSHSVCLEHCSKLKSHW